MEYRTWPDYALPARTGSVYYDWLVKIVGFNPHGNPMVNRPPRHVYFPKASTYVKFTSRKMLMKLLVSKQLRVNTVTWMVYKNKRYVVAVREEKHKKCVAPLCMVEQNQDGYHGYCCNLCWNATVSEDALEVLPVNHEHEKHCITHGRSNPRFEPMCEHMPMLNANEVKDRMFAYEAALAIVGDWVEVPPDGPNDDGDARGGQGADSSKGRRDKNDESESGHRQQGGDTTGGSGNMPTGNATTQCGAASCPEPEPMDIEVVCEVCNRRYPGERFPFARCNFCGDAPSFHHGRCCPEKAVLIARTFLYEYQQHLWDGVRLPQWKLDGQGYRWEEEIWRRFIDAYGSDYTEVDMENLQQHLYRVRESLAAQDTMFPYKFEAFDARGRRIPSEHRDDDSSCACSFCNGRGEFAPSASFNSSETDSCDLDRVLQRVNKEYEMWEEMRNERPEQVPINPDWMSDIFPKTSKA